MYFKFDASLANGYSSQSQISRRLSEGWVENNIYCPNCGNDHIVKFENNRPVADFFCDSCREEFELKSKKAILPKTINDGSYKTMIERINSDKNPNFFFLTYNKANWTVNNFIVIPKFYFVNDIIKQRNPLSPTAQRKGWSGCNIMLDSIPQRGRLFLVKDSLEVPKEVVIKSWNESEFLKHESQVSRGWLVDIMCCVDKIPENEFTLDDMYKFEDVLKLKYPENNFIRDKIRQQLQLLRDKGIIDFVSRGMYRKI